MPGNKYYEDLKSIKQWEEHSETLKHVYHTPHTKSPQFPQKDYEKYIPQKEYNKLKTKKPQWTKEDQMLEDSLWDE